MSRVKEEIRTALAEADAVDEEEDRLYGERRGDELPKEIRKKEIRLKKLEEAFLRLEGEEKEKINLTDLPAAWRRRQERMPILCKSDTG